MNVTEDEQLGQIWTANMDVARRLAGIVLDSGANLLHKQIDVAQALVQAALAAQGDLVRLAGRQLGGDDDGDCRAA